MTDAERQAALEAIGAEIRTCTRCRLHQGRTRAVPGEGHPGTEVVFVGEGPGYNEDQQGRPFVGRAGELLEKLLASINWKRDEVFIANVVKCRPPDNRDPEPDEIAACAPYLTRQLAVLDPALVVTLGRFSMARFNPGAKISQVHGTYKPAHPDSGAANALALFMYHPAAALRTPALETQSHLDIAGVPKALQEARSRRAAMAAKRSGSAAAPSSAAASGAAGEAISSGQAPAAETGLSPEDTRTPELIDAETPAPKPAQPAEKGSAVAAAEAPEATAQSGQTGQLGLF
jgi:uracil-DNA glycosylase family 4